MQLRMGLKPLTIMGFGPVPPRVEGDPGIRPGLGPHSHSVVMLFYMSLFHSGLNSLYPLLHSGGMN